MRKPQRLKLEEGQVHRYLRGRGGTYTIVAVIEPQTNVQAHRTVDVITDTGGKQTIAALPFERQVVYQLIEEGEEA